MDFLSLFPTTSQQSSLIFSAYRQMGLLCWSAAKQNELLLVSAIKSDVGNDKQNVLFKCVSKISLSPELPRNMDFDQILVNQTGSLVALIGKKMVFVVEMDQEFWDRRHIPGLNFEASVEHLRPQYFARTDLVHITLFMRKYPPTVLKAIWFEHRPDENGIFKNAQIQNGLLALLFSDNVIRLYNIPSLMDRPQFQLDFNTLLPDWSPAASESGDEIGGVGSISRPHSTLGFITQLVSFDFGPIQSSTGGSTSTQSATLFGSLLAMDSNGEIYMGFFPFQQQNSNAIPPPFGPLPCHFPQTQPPISSRLLCAARDLYSIRHSHSQHISLWSLASEDGILIHFALSQRNGTDNLNNFAAGNSPQCELFALECLEIEGNDQQKEDSRKAASSKLWDVTKLTKNTATTNYQFAKILRLMNDLPNASSPSYFAICSRDLFRIDLTELVAHLLQNCANFHQSQKFAPTKLPQSIVHQMLMFMDSGEGKNANITSVSSLELQSSNFLGPSTSSNQQLELEDENRQHFLAAMCSTNNSAQKQFDGNGKTSPILQWKHSFMATLINAGPSNSTNISSPSLLDSLLSPPSQKPKQQRNLPKLPSISEEIRRQLAGERNYNILPTIKFDEEIEGDEQQKLAQRLKILSLVLNVLQNILLERALPARQNAIEFATQRAVLLLAGFQAVEQFRENAQLRLTNIFRQITDLKSQILRRQHQIQMLEERIRKIALALQPLMFPAPKEEEEAIENLRKMQQRLMECRREMKKLDQRLCEHRQFIFANPSNSSHHSSNMMMGGGGGGPMPAQMFILSKNGRQCAKLREQIQQLMKGKNNG